MTTAPPSSPDARPPRALLEDAITDGDVTRELLVWFDTHRRELPWRDEPTAYRVWVSEIMLQQTQVVTVLPYFERWMRRLPALADLAAADLDEVLTLWSGLGYYRRARMLHAAAQHVLAHHGGELPQDVSALMTIPGIGRYTAGAIASIAFGQRAALVDGNVTRVLARLTSDDGDVSTGPVQRRIWALAERLVPDDRPGDLNQALMELGATVCTPRKPACLLCPLTDRCVGRLEGRLAEIPFKPRKAARRPMLIATAVLRCGDRVLLTQRPPEGLFGGLWELPGVEVPTPAPDPLDACRQALHHALAETLVSIGEPGPAFEHTLSHIDLTVQPFHVEVPDDRATDLALIWARPAEWVPVADVRGRALSSIMRRVIDGLMGGAAPPPV